MRKKDDPGCRYLVDSLVLFVLWWFIWIPFYDTESGAQRWTAIRNFCGFTAGLTAFLYIVVLIFTTTGSGLSREFETIQISSFFAWNTRIYVGSRLFHRIMFRNILPH